MSEISIDSEGLKYVQFRRRKTIRKRTPKICKTGKLRQNLYATKYIAA